MMNTMTDNSEKFWGRMKEINAGMLGISDRDRLVPMSHYAEPETGTLWFITAAGTYLVDALEAGRRPAEYILASGSEGLYTHIKGTLTVSNDPTKLDELWNVVASSWFEDGKRDDDVRLLSFRVNEAEVWATSGSASFFYEIAKAQVTGEKPDIGEHFAIAV